MMDLPAVIGLFGDLPEVELTTWIERRWVLPDQAENGFVFREFDIARVRLIHDLSRDMAVAEDTMPLVLSLLDQVYELRRALESMVRALEQQPAEVREAVVTAVRPKGVTTAG
jgi:chaperone modulatory protein CbpM